jgi:hypothetical protein
MAKIRISVNDQRIEDLLTNATEGGSNYWYMIEKYIYPEGKTADTLKLEFPHCQMPFNGGAIVFSSLEEPEKAHVILDYKKCLKGLSIMAKKYPSHFADWQTENDDAITADVWLQCALYGDVIYG